MDSSKNELLNNPLFLRRILKVNAAEAERSTDAPPTTVTSSADAQSNQHQQPQAIHRPPLTSAVAPKPLKPAPKPKPKPKPRPLQQSPPTLPETTIGDSDVTPKPPLIDLRPIQTTVDDVTANISVNAEAPDCTHQPESSPRDLQTPLSSPLPLIQKETVPKKAETSDEWNISETPRRGLRVYMGIYQWRFKFDDDESWKDFERSLNENQEMAYCNVDQKKNLIVTNAAALADEIGTDSLSSSSSGPIVIATSNDEMVLMSLLGKKIGTLKRVELDAENDNVVLVEAGCAATTLWQWYWMNDSKQWQPFDLYANRATPANTADDGTLTLDGRYISAEEIQTQYAKLGSTGSFKCNVKHVCMEYLFDFNKMVQINILSDTVRQLKRRPAWFRSLEQKSALLSLQKTLLGKNAVYTVALLPETWDIGATMCGSDYQLVPVFPYNSTALEYGLVLSLLTESLPSATVTRVLRIQNRFLWEEFHRYKKLMQRKRGGREVTPRRLFHGTSEKYIRAICRDGFDWRISGSTTGTLYGKGSYFARDAKYSNDYTDCNTLFIVQVLVGDYVNGDCEMVRPPNKPNGEMYDTCVDDVTNPSIFVAFDVRQTYPEYLVEYSP